MALAKAIRQEDGVATTYHRIWFTQHFVNKRTSIAVLSYVDDVAREMEQESPGARSYKQVVTYETDYNENMTIEQAYEYLKTLPEFEGALDV
jgi:hypothetical protein